ncbi:Protein kinase domain protein [Pseudobythopirellula maris]|uniref:Protein kinase domain protein n=1 Tax=Pseudobythopirellula maris TaxID=2527991 RepID=A0A5C5ZSA8_9BACT|nr:hypothetical protein [Pseudobythopirellula maris]TWT89847.1 Protein kinase domain protein [Pseudobythopirellula maris]
MTIKPSSSQPRLSLADEAGRRVELGDVIGSGGEGRVYAVTGAPRLVAKVYHKTPLEESHADKLRAMVAMRNEQLTAVSAWPKSLLVHSMTGKPFGLLLPLVGKSRELHELYGVTSRRMHFPGAHWRHLTLAARNTAAAFATMHSAGMVIGDVNQGNLLVDDQMRVQFIDCDSFQIETSGKLFSCPVGTPHFTPPELQSMRLRDVRREPQHDAFGLAILIFHLLFIGRHPFAGRYLGDGDMPIEKAIAERRFAFSKDRDATRIDPPPASLTLDDLTPRLAAMFEAALRGEPGSRPSALDWTNELDSLVRSPQTCEVDSTHLFANPRMGCPWCRIEGLGGPSFFTSSDSMGDSSASGSGRLQAVEAAVARASTIEFPDLLTKRLAVPPMPAIKKPKSPPRWSLVDWAAAAWCVSAGAALLSGLGLPVAIGAAATGIAAAGYLGASKEGRSRRRRLEEDMYRLDELTVELERGAEQVVAGHAAKRKAFFEAVSDLDTEVDHYRSGGEKAEEVIREIETAARDKQRTKYLREHAVREHLREPNGRPTGIALMLESFGIETVNDIDTVALNSVPNLEPHQIIALLNWRAEVESEFRYQPEIGMTARDAAQHPEEALKRFKLVKATRVLNGVKKLKAATFDGHSYLEAAIARFEARVRKWREMARDLQDFQALRSPIERLINQPGGVLFAFAVGPPLLAMMVWFLFG